VIVRPERPPVVHPFRVFVYSIEGQAFRVTASDVAEPPLLQGKACYWETRCLPEVPAFYRILLEGDGWGLMGKSHTQRLLWKQRHSEELADSMLPKTVPPYTSSLVWSLTGNSVAARMAALGVGELHARWQAMKAELDAGRVVLQGDVPTSADELYDEVALRWRSRTRAGEREGPGVPPSHGINDSYLNVSRRGAPACSEMSVEEEDAALGYLRTFAASGGSLDLERRCGLGMGSEQFGAVAPRASTRTRKAPESLQMPPTMRGGDRAWQERMPAEVEIDHECSVRMTRGSTGRRGLAKRGAKKELQSGDDTEAPSSAQGERPGVVAKST